MLARFRSIRIYMESTFSLEDHNDHEKDIVMRTVSSVVSGIIDSLKNKGGRYASEEETGEDMSQILVSILFSVLCQKGGTPHPAATTRGTAGRGSVPFTPQRRCARVLPVS